MLVVSAGIWRASAVDGVALVGGWQGFGVLQRSEGLCWSFRRGFGVLRRLAGLRQLAVGLEVGRGERELEKTHVGAGLGVRVLVYVGAGAGAGLGLA